jgi:hypothetical protein
MVNNSIFATLIVLIASLCFFNVNKCEGFMDISGTNARHAYLPQTYKNEMSIRNFRPHGTNNREEVRELETFNYNPGSIRNNINDVEQQFKSIEGFQQRNNMNNKSNYNNHKSNNLPKHNLSETYIPQRPDYELSRGVGVSVVTPNGYRNGAKPSYGVDLLRGNIFESYSTPQFGTPENPSGNLRYRGDTQNPDPRGKTKPSPPVETSQYGPGNQPDAYQMDPRESFVPKAIRRGHNSKLQQQQQQSSEGYKQYSRRRSNLIANDKLKQQFMEPPINL